MAKYELVSGNSYLDGGFKQTLPERLVVLDYVMAETERCTLKIYYDYTSKKFVMEMKKSFPEFTKNDMDHNGPTYREYTKIKNWLNKVESYVSTIVQRANNDLKEDNLEPQWYTFLCKCHYKDNGVKQYELSYKINRDVKVEKDKPVEKQANLVLTDESIVYFDPNTQQYVIKQLDRVSDDVKNKIAELVQYMQSNAGNDIYIQNLMKGNFTSMGDPEM